MTDQPAATPTAEPYICRKLLMTPPARCYLRDGPTIACAFELRDGEQVRICTGCVSPTDIIDAL